ncbi:sensor histidine kinase [soil metagenome]
MPLSMSMSLLHTDNSTEPRRFGIRARLLALLLPGIVALLALDSWSDYHALSETVANAYDQSLLEPVKALGNSIVVRPDGKVQVHEAFSVEAMFAATSARYKHLHVGIMPVGTDGPETTLMGVPDLPSPPVAPPDQSVGKPVFYDGWYQGRPVRIAALRQTVYRNQDSHDAQDSGNAAWQVLIQAAESTGPRTHAVNESLQQELWRDIRMLLVVTLLVWLGVAWTLRPLERLRASLRERQPDDLKPLDPTGMPQEVMPLVDAVNHHIESHRTMVAEHSQFLADASHQLRTPLAILSIQAGYAVRETDPARMRESLRAIVTQLARTRRLSEQLLALAHATHQDNAADAPALVDLNAVARAVVLQYLPLARENDQDLGWIDARGELPFHATFDSAQEAQALDTESKPTRPVLPVHANEAELHEVLSNLVHNAIKYTPRGGSITVSVRRDARHALAEVCDSGPGISADRRASVFQRFQRDASNESRITQGAGLGLTIARSYARRNQGDIELADAGSADGAVWTAGPASTAGAGLRATLRLPLVSLK